MNRLDNLSNITQQTVSTERTAGQVARFSPESRQGLAERGFTVYELNGRTLPPGNEPLSIQSEVAVKGLFAWQWVDPKTLTSSELRVRGLVD